MDIPSVDDTRDGDQVSTITATAPGLAPATQDVTVGDDDDLELSIEPSPNQPVDPATGLPVTQEDGAPVELVISRNGPTDEPLVVTLTNGDPDTTDTPATVTIPAGEDSVTVLIDPVDEDIVDGDTVAPVTATAPDYAPATQAVLVEDDDAPALTIAPAANTPIDPATGNPLIEENGAPTEIVISRNTPTDEPLEVFLTNGDPSETDVPVSVIIPAGETSVTVDIAPLDDDLVDGDQVSTITATAPGLAPATQDVTVGDDDDLELSIEPSPNQPVDPATGLPVTQEDGAPVELVISRNGPTDEPLVVTLTNGDPDTTDTPATVTIPAGEDSVTVLIDPVDEDIVDGDTVAPVTATAPDYAPATQAVLVEDDDAPALTIAPAANTPIDPATGNPLIEENGAPTEIVISRNTPTDEPLEVFLTNGDPSETDVPVSVIIPAGETSVTVDIAPLDDDLVDGDQVSTITATAPGLAPATQDVTVGDDDDLELSIEPSPNQPVDPATGLPVTQEDGAPVELVISRNGPTDEPLVVTLTNGDPDTTDTPATVTIPAGEDSVTVLIDPVDEDIVDGDTVAPVTATAPDYAPATQAVLVEDDDAPALTIAPAANTPIDPATGNPLIEENGAPTEIVISRNTPTDEPLEVFLTNGDPSETDVPVSVIIPAGETSVTVDIAPLDDDLVDGDQVSTITATAPGLAPATQDVTVGDDDDLELSIEPSPNQPVDPATGLPVTQEDGAPVELVISRNGPTDEPLVVTLTNGDPDTTDTPATVTIPAGEDSVTVLIDPVDEDIVDGDTVAPVTATAPDYAPATQAVLVEDDDAPALTIAPAANTPIDPATGNPLIEENGAPTEIVISRNTPTDEPLEVFLTNGDPSETDVPVSVIIPAGETSVTVDIAPLDDDLVDGDQVSTITATAPGLAPATQDVTVGDDDDLELSIEPSPNQPVDPATGLPVTQEDGAPVELVISRNGPTDEPLVVTLTNGDPDTTDTPATVTIPAGEDSVTVLIDPVDEDIVDGDTVAPVTATAPDYAPATQAVVVEDDDMLMLTIAPAPDQDVDGNGDPITQEDGAQVCLVVTRNGPLDQPLTVTVFNNDTSEVSSPMMVVIPAGEASVEFKVDPVDDGITDGTQSADIEVFAKGYTSDTVKVVVEDDDAPQGASISGRYFCDEDEDNLDVGEAEPGVEGALVSLRLDGEGIIASTVTDSDGNYSFDGLAAGRYRVIFQDPDDLLSITGEKAFVTADVGDDDTIDSDVVRQIRSGEGQTRFFDLAASEVKDDVDAGISVAQVGVPSPHEDSGEVCADDPLTLDVLANDEDPDGDQLTITQVDGQAIVEGQTVMTAAGTNVTLSNGQLVFDGADAYSGLNINESANETIAYTVSDGDGNAASTTVALTFKGDANDYASLAESFGDIVDPGLYVVSGSLADPDAWSLSVSDTGDERLDGATFVEAYCLDFFAPIPLDTPLEGALLSTEDSAEFGTVFASGGSGVSSFNNLEAAENMDLINYILAQDWTNDPNQDIDGWDVQFAIWELTNDVDTDQQTQFFQEATVDNVDFILADAEANGEGFMLEGDGGIATTIIDPLSDDMNTQQPFIVAYNFDDYDCIC